tara:strand:+ start:58 stop:696 length:639 start_codon:yes stop_codon:yes gene_type:complete
MRKDFALCSFCEIESKNTDICIVCRDRFCKKCAPTYICDRYGGDGTDTEHLYELCHKCTAARKKLRVGSLNCELCSEIPERLQKWANKNTNRNKFENENSHENEIKSRFSQIYWDLLELFESAQYSENYSMSLRELIDVFEYNEDSLETNEDYDDFFEFCTLVDTKVEIIRSQYSKSTYPYDIENDRVRFYWQGDFDGLLERLTDIMRTESD